MDKYQLAQLAQRSNPPTPQGLELLNGCTESHPYFQAAEVLRLLHLQSLNPDGLAEHLSRAAFMLPNRRLLHTLLHTQDRPIELLLDSNEQYAMPHSNGQRRKSTNIDDLFLLPDGESIEPTPGSNDLIDQFLQNLPNLSNQRPPMPSPLVEQPENIDMAKNSIATTDEVVTEQMAEIYVAQGYKNKAIEIFRQLCLKFPEKSSYFAARIEQISQELNN